MGSLQRIVFVEDEADIQAIAQMALEVLGGYTVKIFASGNAAVREAGAFAPDLFLLDVMMPGMDGIATLAALRAQPDFKNTPVVFMTAKVQPEETAYYRSLTACGVIHKPFDPMTLAAQVQHIWEQEQSG